MSEGTSDADRRIVQEIAGRFGPAAFMRRGKVVETTWARLIESGQHARLEHLEIVRLRLGQLFVLAGEPETLRPWLPDHADREVLVRLHDELRPVLRLQLAPTSSQRALRSALRELIEAMELFNGRWERWLAEVDLTAVNKAREDYNRWYLIEKECALGSVAIARREFKPLPPVTRTEVEKELPLLTLPGIAEG